MWFFVLKLRFTATYAGCPFSGIQRHTRFSDALVQASKNLGRTLRCEESSFRWAFQTFNAVPACRTSKSPTGCFHEIDKQFLVWHRRKRKRSVYGRAVGNAETLTYGLLVPLLPHFLTAEAERWYLYVQWSKYLTNGSVMYFSALSSWPKAVKTA